jgi:hypothetical protein
MAVPSTVSPDATYATKVNIKFPGTAAQATAAEAKAQTDIDSRFHSGITVTVGAGSVQVSN